MNVFAGTAGISSTQLDYPFGIARDPNSGTLYIADWGCRVMSYLSGASNGTVVAGGNGAGTGNTQLYLPIGLYLDLSSNSLIIANYGAHNIVRWVLGATSWTLVAGSSSGTPGFTSTLLINPYDVTLDSLGNVYVADTGNERIQFFLANQSNGTTVAGITLTAGATSTLHDGPSGVVVDSQFNVYVADSINNRIQEF